MKEDKDDLKYWLCFSQFNNIGPARWQRLLKYFPDMESAFKAGHNELVQAGLEPEIAQELISARARIEPEALLDRLDKEKVGAMTIKDTAYPAQLKEIHGAPPLLYYKGDINITNELCLAVVGARKYTPYGKQAAEHLVYVLAANRLVIVSGLALGIDAIAHETALAVNGLTVAVLGAGLDRQNIYPSANRYLADKILSSGGALVSEFPLGMAPLKHNFPQRNRVISGLSVGTLVVEANEGSGSLITAKHALDQGWTHYSPPAGLPELRKAVAEDVGSRRGILVDPSEVVITPGAKPIMFYTILALVEPGDEVLYPDPGFPIYASMIGFVGAKPVPYILSEERGFGINVMEIVEKINDRTRLVIVNSPNNPTGGIISRSEMETLAKILKTRDVIVLSDEIYSRLIYEDDHVSPATFSELRDQVIILDGFSKTYAMTGWRLGYGVMRPDVAQQVARLMTNSNSCTASFTQIAGVAALRGDQSSVAVMLTEFRRRREVIVEALNRIPGFHCRNPHGAFYAFPNIKGTGKCSRDLADALLNEAGVACLSGTAFGERGEGYLRFSFANSIENIRKGLDRIDAWVRKHL